LPYLIRPATRIEQAALPELTEKELLALVIGGAYASSDAYNLLESIGGNLAVLYNTPLDELARNYAGIGYNTAKRIKAALELGRRLVSSTALRTQIGSPEGAVDYFNRAGLGLCNQEELWVINLDTKNRVISLSKVYRGNVNSSIIRASEILRDAVRLSATAIIVGHNHPSGESTPSPEDVMVTRTLREAARLLGIDLLDHMIVCTDSWTSLKQRGLGFD
jgi:DNA repair protein RadC